MKNLIVFAMVAMSLTIFNGCQKDELNSQLAEEVQPQETVKPVLRAKNGILVFPNHENVRHTLNAIVNMSEEERRFWEGKHNFVSQQSIFHDIVNAELQLDEPYENMSEEELRGATPPAKHSDIYLKYLKMGIINEYVGNDGIEMYDYATCAPYLASILNKDGIFVVGDTMFQYSATAVKQWIGCDINNPHKIINTFESTDEIEVKLQLKSTTVQYGNWEYDDGNKRRIRIGINFNSYKYHVNGTIWRYEHWVEVISQKKNFWGNWKYNWTDMYLKGNWEYKIKYVSLSDPYMVIQNYTDNVGFHDYPNIYHVYASNLKSTCSIQSGSIFPYGSIFDIWQYDALGELAEIYDVLLNNFSWEVTGHGNVKATVANS